MLVETRNGYRAREIEAPSIRATWFVLCSTGGVMLCLRIQGESAIIDDAISGHGFTGFPKFCERPASAGRSL